MNTRNTTTNKESVWARPWVSYALATVGLALLFGIGKAAYTDYTVLQNLRQVNASVSAAQQQKQKLSSSVDYYSSPAFLDEYAKNILNLKSPNEHVIIFSSGAAENTFPATLDATAPATAATSNWWTNLVKSITKHW